MTHTLSEASYWAAFAVLLIAGYALAIRRRSVPLALFVSAYLVLYLLDAVFTQQRGALFLSRTFDYAYVSDRSIQVAFVMIVAAYVVFLVAYVLLSGMVPNPAIRPFASYSSGVLPPRLWVAAAPLALLLPVGADIARGDSLGLLLSNRQVIYQESLLATLLLYLAPGSACLGVVTFVLARRATSRVGGVLVALAAFAVLLLGGSRSALLLNAGLPVTAYIGARTLRRRLPHWPVSLTTLVLTLCLIAGGVAVIIGASTYRDLARGDQGGESLLVSPDATQYDALLQIIESDIRATTYPSAALFYVPRHLWPAKPESCNSVYSLALYPERYTTTGAEMTCSILGEAYVNAGVLGPLIAGVLLACIVVASDRLLAIGSAGGLYGILGWIVVFRGINLIRGDLLNVVVPLAFTVLLFQVARRRPTHR